MASDRRTATRWLVRLLKVAIIVGILFGLRGTLSRAYADLQQHEWTIHWSWLVLAGGFLIVGFLPCGLYWWLVLRRLGQPVSLWIAMRAYLVGHVGKYAPGKGMVIVIRTALLAGHYRDIPAAVIAVFFETLTLTGAACVVAAVALRWAFDITGVPVWGVAALALPFVAATTPPLLAFFIHRIPIASVRAASQDLAARLRAIPARTLFAGWALSVLSWCALGLSLWSVVRGLSSASDAPLSQFPFYLGSIAIAFVAGFLSFLPGGAVAREAVLIKLLSTRYDEGTAVAAALLLRFVWVVAEVGLSAILYLVPVPGPRSSD
ncbi:MAG: YbhN family protein [Pirellulales bacterium]